MKNENVPLIKHCGPYEVSARLRSFKKPKSKVEGDFDPKIVTRFHDILAIPLAYIYNKTLNTLEWPNLWKSETVTVIPKNTNPTNLSELRNLSCTPLFSKVLESFVLEKIKEEVTLSRNQYGGIKGCSTEHFLIESWDRILTHLETPSSASSLISVDFEKAFNRMDHYQCLYALNDLGASENTVDYVAAFLYGRKMSVQIGSAMSVPRLAPGGSPQGSILGNLLFCITTNRFAEMRSPEIYIDTLSSDSSDSADERVEAIESRTPITAISTPTTRGQFPNFRPPRCLVNLSGEFQSDDDSFEFFRVRPRLDLTHLMMKIH